MLAAVIVIVFLAVGATSSWVAWTGSQRRLAPRGLLGIPLPAVRSSDASWYAAHESAAGPLGLGGGIALTCGVGVVAVGADRVGLVLAGVGMVLVVVCVTLATVAAQRAARAAAGS